LDVNEATFAAMYDATYFGGLWCLERGAEETCNLFASKTHYVIKFFSIVSFILI
jgi:hypothetical protein